MPVRYSEWNRRWGAPFGRSGYGWPLHGTSLDIRKRGPFAWQDNNTTREFEYPWAYEQIANKGSGLTIVDIGGSLGGMQFVLAMAGHRVITVDPGLASSGLGWNVDIEMHQRICRALGVKIEVALHSLADSGLGHEVADIVLSISSLEHFSAADLQSTAQTIPRILKPSGLAVITVDCFIDISPFTTQSTNRWGRNISVYDFMATAGLALKDGVPRELVGFPDFDPDRILSQLPTYYVGSYPCLAQCFTASRSA